MTAEAWEFRVVARQLYPKQVWPFRQTEALFEAVEALAGSSEGPLAEILPRVPTRPFEFRGCYVEP